MAGSGVTLGFLKYVLGLDSLAFQDGLGDAEKRLKASQRSLQKTADKFTSIGTGLSLAITAPLTAFGASAFNAASDAAELQSAFDVTFAKTSDTMNRWAETTGDALGRSTQEMQKAANTFGIFFNTAVDPAKAAQMSQTFATLAQDLGSFFNVDTETAIEKLRSGLSGESEPLRDFGVFLTEASVSAKAMELGLSGVGNELTEQEKIVARYALILEATKNAQGDVTRTSGQTANQIRAARAAFEELQVTVGTKLLPVITPLIEKLGVSLNYFAQLPEPVQNVAFGIAAAAAAAGPLAVGIGSIMQAGAPLLPWVVKLAGPAGFAALGPALGIVAAGALAVYAAYQNWPEISAWIDGVRDRTVEAAGKIDAELAGINDWAAKVDARFGIPPKDVLLNSIGEWAARTWAELNRYDLQRWADGVDAAFVRMWTSATASVQKLYNGVKTWLGDRLGAVLDWAGSKVDWLGGKFFQLYDNVVGHSYVPDMVDEIGQHMARLDNLMVQPAAAATGKVSDEFRALAREVQPILDRIFPEQARSNQLASEIATVERDVGKLGFTAEQAAAAVQRLRDEYSREQGGLPTAADVIGADRSAIELPDAELAPMLVKSIKGNWEQLGAANDNLRASFAETARDVAASLQGLVSNIKSGDWLGALSSVLGIVAQLQGGKAAMPVFNLGGFGGARAMGGPVAGGKTYLVGERGPELFTAGRSGYITPNNKMGAAQRPMVVQIVADEGATFVPRVAGISGNVSVETVRGSNRAAARRGRQRLA